MWARIRPRTWPRSPPPTGGGSRRSRIWRPYTASDGYGIVSAPTVVVVDGDGRVADVVESWDRDGVNRVSSTLAGLLHAEPVIVSEADDGLPGFKPG